MANTAYFGNTTKVHMGGAGSDVDVHLEIYDGEVDTRFQYQAIFKSLSTQRSVNDKSNTYRIDRLNTSAVKGRTSGIALDSTRVTNDKLVMTVDTVLYIRNPIDYQDDWTSPDWLREMGQNNGSQFAETFDQAHLIQIIKGRTWTAPAHLKPAFSDGAEIVCNLLLTADTQAKKEANAVALAAAHKSAVDTLIKRKVPLSDIVTLMYTDEYSVLLEHPKLLNVSDYAGNEGNSYGERRVTRMNSLPIVENTEFPIAVNASHILGPNFNVVAADAACHVVVFSKSKTLVTVEAKPFTSRIWDDEREFCNVLDCYAMYTVGQRRPDTAVVIKCVYA
jgi:hypothetical protein